MHERLQEYVDQRGTAVRADAAAGVIRGVKVLGLRSRNGRVYREEALARAAGLYEGAKVNVNHARQPAAPRDYRDRIGAIRNVTVRGGEGLFGDFHFNPEHALAGQLLWDAEHAPQNVGFSHNVTARVAREGETLVVEEIAAVESVDLVADPATTAGLFEGEEGEVADAPQPGNEHPSAAAAGTDEVEPVQAVEALRQRRRLVERLLADHGLPEPDEAEGPLRALVGRRFLELVESLPDEGTVRALLEERGALARRLAPLARGPQHPRCREQVPLDIAGPADAASFAAAITVRR